MFGSTINYTKVDIDSNTWSKGASVTWGFSNSVRIASDIYARNSPSTPDGAEFSDMSTGSLGDRALFIHEMAHIWQSQNGVWTTVRGFFMHAGAIISGTFKGLFTSMSIRDAIDQEEEKLYDIMGGGAEALGKYNIEQAARAIQRNYSADEKTKNGEGLTYQEKRAQEIMKKTPDFPDAKVLE